ncbi:hypothetical protein V491_09214 [Pseudogymnoascus sp. VKM F-3775]|nr:hypothetical protein V491_09214 [Pseudogymnoascus sp. VKM F-3775]
MVSLSTESKPSYGIRRAVDQTAILHNDPSESSGPGRGDGSGIGSPDRGGLDSPGRGGLGSPNRGGLGSRGDTGPGR